MPLLKLFLCHEITNLNFRFRIDGFRPTDLLKIEERRYCHSTKLSFKKTSILSISAFGLSCSQTDAGGEETDDPNYSDQQYAEGEDADDPNFSDQQDDTTMHSSW